MPQVPRLSRRQLLTLIGATGLTCLTPPRISRAQPLLAQREWRVTGHAVPALSAFDEAVRASMQQRTISAGALAISRSGRLVLARGYAWSDDPAELVEPSALFRVASLAKPLTATAVLLLVQRGQLALDTRLTDVLTLTPLPGATTDPRLGAVTIAHLLQHLGGWDRDRGYDPSFSDRPIAAATGRPLPITIADIIAYTTGRSLDYAPGTRVAYGNYGFLLLGRVIEQVTGMAYARFVEEAIMTPLNLRRLQLGRSAAALRLPGEVVCRSLQTGTTVIDPSGATVPMPYGGFNMENRDAHGGWVASAIDLARFAASFNQGEAQPLLAPATIATMHAPPPTGVNAEGWYYAKGWQVRPLGDGRYDSWHTGSLPGTTAMIVRRWDDTHFVALFNQRDDAADPNGQSYLAIMETLYTLAGRTTAWPDHDLFPEYLPTPSPTPQPTPSPTPSPTPQPQPPRHRVFLPGLSAP